MNRLEVRDIGNALLVFADIVDSSKFSSVLGFKKYAERIIQFQELFKTIGERYFSPVADRATGYSQVNARGDEGTVFRLEPQLNERANLVFKAIEFLFHLKGRLYFEPSNRVTDIPIRMGIGAGIHVGTIAYAAKLENSRSVISNIEGFSINKAKRVESSSRGGVFSRVILSEEARKLLEGQPILLSPMSTSLKGIEENTDLYEVRSGLFSGLVLDEKDPGDQNLINNVLDLSQNPHKIDEPWLKALIISVLDVLLANSVVTENRNKYRKLQFNLAWYSTHEDDPILLYLRARDFLEQKKFTQQIRYLKEIIERYPEFIFAKKQMVNACWEIALYGNEPAEKVFARDVAEEFLTRFSRFLSDKEKHDFSEIVKTSIGKVE
jgi:class 3 adenylate cyclase